MKLLVIENFQHNGPMRDGMTLDVSKDTMLEELSLGTHPVTNKWMSGLLNHCIPANDATSQFILKNLPKGVNPEDIGVEPAVELESEQDDTEEFNELWGQFEDIGKAYDKRWGLDRLREELKKAKHETGAGKKPAIKPTAKSKG